VLEFDAREAAMPTNVTPEYRKIEQAFRRARDPQERLDLLREMLRTIPKHKGTEHVQADIKTRIKQMTEQLAGPRKGGGRGGPTHSVRPAGAAQVALLGPPNGGKSSLHARLTGSQTPIGPYPFTTHAPMPGMLPFEDIQFQLVDLPPVSAEFLEPWMYNAVERSEAALLVVDLADPACVEQVQILRDRLAERKIVLSERWPGLNARDLSDASANADGNLEDENDEDDEVDPFHISLPTLLIANKSDLDPDPDEVNVLEELLGVRFPAVTTSAESGTGLDEIGPLLFRGLEIVRVYTKTPGEHADMTDPFTVRRGDTVLDVARLVHKDIAESLKFARMWGERVYDGQQVGPDHEVCDGDIVELHAS
jgi:ribosome-interacting GTPase 1